MLVGYTQNEFKKATRGNPDNIYFFKINNRSARKVINYVQS